LVISEEWLSRIQSQMPSLPHELYARFTKEFKLPEYDANVLTDSKEIAEYFNAVCQHTTNYKAASNWVMGPVKSHLNELALHVSEFPLLPEQIADIIALVDSNKINHTAASRNIFPYLIKNPTTTALDAAEELNLIQESDDNALAGIIDQVLQNNSKKVAEFKAGKTSLVGMFMGEIMKLTKGKADPKTTNRLLQEKLKAL
jgi:aspartyl-tRNA(Asn)/glutamyl-tRNA(Gln) amidotransferase subunit B